MNKEKIREYNEKINDKIDLIQSFTIDRLNEIIELKDKLLEEIK